MAQIDPIYHSSKNKSITPLSGGATYTGTWEYVGQHAYITVSSKADVAGTLYVDFGVLDSTGNVETRSTLTYVRAAGVNTPHTLKVTRPWARVRFVNGSSAQSSFDINMMVGGAGLLVSPLNGSLSKYSDAIVVRPANTAIDIASGRFAGFSYFDKFGRNAAVSTADVPEDIWNGGGVYTGFPTSGTAETVDVFSSSPNDDEGGSGAEKVTIYGLDADWLEQSEEITLNGTAAVTSTGTWQRVNRLIVTQSANGANTAFNAGTITVRHTTTTANVFVTMRPGVNQTEICCATVPAGKTLYLQKVYVGIDRSNTATGSVALWYRPNGGTPRIVRTFSVSNTDAFTYELDGGVAMAAKTDFAMRVNSCSANNVTFIAFLDGIYVDD